MEQCHLTRVVFVFKDYAFMETIFPGEKNTQRKVTIVLSTKIY